MAKAKDGDQNAPSMFAEPVAPETAPVNTNAPSANPDKKPFLMVMDGHAMVYRAWFGMSQARPFTVRRTGEDVRGVYSFITTFFKALNDLKPTHVAIAFDPPGPTFRNERYAEYKANRPPAPNELIQNLNRVKQVMGAFSVPIYELPGFEADDVLGTIAKFADDNAVDTLISTGDTDTLQLVSPHVRVMLTSGFSVTKIYDEAAVSERYGGLTPDQQRDVKALTGDTSDNIPGVPGVGIKTAIKLVQEFGNVEELLDHLDDVTPPRIQGLVKDNTEQLRESKVLVTIVRDAPIGFDLDDALFGVYNRQDVVDLFQELEFSSLVARIPAMAQVSATEEPDAPVDGGSPEPMPEAELTSVTGTSVTIIDSKQELDAMLAALRAAPTFVIEAHGSSTHAMETAPVGLAFAAEAGKGYYVPLGHSALSGQEITQLPMEEVMAQVRPLLEDNGREKSGHNLNFTLTLLSNYGLQPPHVAIGFDTAIAAHLVGEKALGLKQLAFNRLSVELPVLTDLTGTGRKQIGFDAVPIADAAAFAATNADATLRLMNSLAVDLERDGLTKFHHDYSMPLIPVLAQVQVNGIAIDTSVLAELDEDLIVQVEAAEKGAYEAVGHEFNINSPAQLGDLLFKELKLPAGRKTQTGYSTDASILENLREAHPVINHVLEYRALTKLKSTYVDTLPLEVNPRTHRIHTTYNQAGSATGRLASNDPNLQNIPVRTQLGLRVRKAFIAEKRPAWKLLSADYSQIDLRALAHLSQDPALMEAFDNDQDIHASTASRIYNVPIGQVTSDMRRLAKVMNFGVAYGLSAFGISRQTEMSFDEGNEFIGDYFGTYPRVREYLDGVVATAKETGYAETLLGRRRYLPELMSPHYPVRQAGERMALNMPVQGTASDIINVAMVEVQKRLENDGFESKMLLQVHDELVFEYPVDEEENLTAMLNEVMPSALELSVPLKIDTKTGDNWADMSA
jgi:DNA polymerase-1